MERAPQRLRETAGSSGLKLGAAVHTCVVIGPDRAVVAPDNERRVITDVVHVIVASFGNVIDMARPLPDLGPHQVIFGLLIV